MRRHGRPSVKMGHGGPGLDTSYPLGLAISGGGHRASLFGLGVLMAMRDAGKQPKQISSVSGGSITNAFLAYRYFSRVPSDRQDDETLWENETRRLFETIVCKGAVTAGWIRILVAFLVLPPIVLMFLLLFGQPPSLWVSLPILVGWATLVLLRGMLIEWLLSRRYLDGAFKQVNLAELDGSDTEHVICCTDLVTGRPLYVSSRYQGQIFRRFEDRPDGVGPRTVRPEEEALHIYNKGVWYDAPGLPVAAAVRASAGFPGIPPRRLQLNKYPLSPGDRGKGKELPSLAFLSDGGIWNNLATQPYEDGFIWGDYGPWVVIVADASAPLEYEQPGPYHLPIWAELRALVRQATIQNTNTVGPRRSSYQDWIRREISTHRSARFESERLYPVITCLETPTDVTARLDTASNPSYWEDFLIDSERDRCRERRQKTKVRIEHLAGTMNDAPDTDQDAANVYERLLSLTGCEASNNKNEADPVASYPTTLDKVDRKSAMAIVMRGYANTAITLYLTGLTDKLTCPRGWLAK